MYFLVYQNVLECLAQEKTSPFTAEEHAGGESFTVQMATLFKPNVSTGVLTVLSAQTESGDLDDKDISASIANCWFIRSVTSLSRLSVGGILCHRNR